ncbi:hypothetical protein C8R45DRAFT_935508 [Mycena sanguinolenta]|nr:hypothetical protein C8R45DRAFT_935508 [Mycena sanguinolenta]
MPSFFDIARGRDTVVSQDAPLLVLVQHRRVIVGEGFGVSHEKRRETNWRMDGWMSKSSPCHRVSLRARRVSPPNETSRNPSPAYSSAAREPQSPRNGHTLHCTVKSTQDVSAWSLVYPRTETSERGKREASADPVKMSQQRNCDDGITRPGLMFAPAVPFHCPALLARSSRISISFAGSPETRSVDAAASTNPHQAASVTMPRSISSK